MPLPSPEVSNRPVNRFLAICVMALSILVVFKFANYVDGQVRMPDEARFMAFAYNLANHETFTYKAPSSTKPSRDPQVEPLWPVALAGVIASATRNGLPVTFECLAVKGANACPEIVLAVKYLNLVFVFLMAVCVGCVVRYFTQGWNYALLGFALVISNKEILFYANSILSETFGSLLFLACSSLALFGWVRRSVPLCLVAGLAGAALAMTKEAFFLGGCLVFVLSIGAMIVSWRMRWHLRSATMFVLLSLPCVVAGGTYSLYNSATVGVSGISVGRGAGVLMLRVEYATMSMQEYFASYLAYTPVLGPKLIRAMRLDSSVERFDRERERSFWKLAPSPEGVVRRRMRATHGYDFSPYHADITAPQKRQLRYVAVVSYLEELPVQIALTASAIYRGLMGEVGNNLICDWRDPFWALSCASGFLATALGSIMLPLIWISGVLFRRSDQLILFGPAFFMVFFYGTLTIFLARYAVVLIPVVILAAVLAIAPSQRGGRETKTRFRFWS